MMLLLAKAVIIKSDFLCEAEPKQKKNKSN